MAELRAGAHGLDPRHRVLSAWQSERLSRTHRDFIADPRFRPAMLFFLEELYGPRDFSRRDQDLERAMPMMIRAIPAELLDTLGMALELHALSFELDHAMVEALSDDNGVLGDITAASYATAYRQLNNRSRREHQLELIRELGNQLDRAVRMPFVYSALKLARRPARLAGFADLQAFLEQGFSAFKHAGGSQAFLDTIIEREYRLLAQLFAGAEGPFELAGPDASATFQ